MNLFPNHIIDECLSVAEDIAKLAILAGSVICIGLLLVGLAP